MPASFPTSVKAFTTKTNGASSTIDASHVNDLQSEVTAIENCLLGNTAYNGVVGGTLAVTGATTLTGALIGNDTTDSTSITTGAFQTDGGLGVAKALWVGGLANIAGAATLQSTLDVTGVATFTGDVLTVAQTDYYASSTITGWSSLTSGRRYIVYKKIGKMVFVNFHLEGTSNATSVSFTLPYTARTQYGEFGGALTFTFDNGATITTAGRVSLPGGASTAVCYSNAGAGAWTAANTKIASGSFWYWTD